MKSMVLKNKRKVRVVFVGIEGQHCCFFILGEVISGELEEGFGDLLGGEGDWFDSFVYYVCVWRKGGW